MKKYLKHGWQLFLDSQHFFYQGFKKKIFKDYLKAYIFLALEHINKFHLFLRQMTIDKHKQFIQLQKTVKGLHSLLPDSHDYVYSILVIVDDPSPKLFHSCLLSACRQTPPLFEILLGIKSPLSSRILEVIKDMEKEYPDKIKKFNFSANVNESIYSLLVQKAKGNYLFFLEQEDWMRPDLLYRYEQCLRAFPNQERTILNCFENRINEKDHFIPNSGTKKFPLHFPYVFTQTSAFRSMLIPKSMWNKAHKLRENGLDIEANDFIFCLDLAEANFTTIPLCLYSHRLKCKSLHSELALPLFMNILKKYAKAKNLDWTFEQGYNEDSIRAIPQNIKSYKIQIVIPFKEQKELTLRCIDTLMKQKGVNFQITAVDNGSQDLSIGKAINELGAEVIRIEEPFNYSRLNNLAITNSKTAQDCDLILFLNNDVELDKEALLEMTRWIDQPSIGIVGARLHYPNGQLQHGGLALNNYYFPDQLWWVNSEKFSSFQEMRQTKIQGIVDAVTAACALIKKENFLKLGGFDEIWYPIAYSDTNLALKLNKIGLKSFYTPYAFGIHHESLSRKESLEDVDNSRWLHELITHSK